MKKILIIVGLCILGGYLIFAYFYFFDKPQEKVCGHFEIIIESDSDENFVNTVSLEKFIDKEGLNPHGKQIKDINTYAIQEALLSNEMIKSAEVYVTNSGSIRAVIRERTPVLRIIPTGESGYYIDRDGERMPLSNMGAAYVPIVTGAVKEKRAKTDLYKLALFLEQDEFWDAQIEQINIELNGDITLIPRVGDQQIVLGNTDDLEKKFERLNTFYKKVLPHTGWNRYTKINLKYDKQVVGTKR